MKLEKGMISNSQLTFLIGAYIQGSLFCTSLIYGISYRDNWLATIVSFLLFVLFSTVYLNLMKMMPGSNLIQIDDIVFGPYMGKLVSAAYISFFILHSVANTRYACDFIVGLFLDQTPLMVFAIILILLCAWAVHCGLEAFARTGFLFSATVFLSIVILFFLNINNMDFKNFLPVLKVPVMDFVQINHIIFSIFYSETFLLMMIMPYVSDQKKLKKSFILGLAIGEATLLLIIITITSTLGIFSTITSNPLIIMTREIDVAKIISRIEFVVLGIVMLSVFVKVTVSFYATAMSFAQVLGLRDYRPLIIALSAVFIALIQPMFHNPIVQSECGKKTWPIYASIFEIVLPLITLITAKFRGISGGLSGGKA